MLKFFTNVSLTTFLQSNELTISNVSFNCRKVVRLTLVKNFNMVKPEEYVKLIEKVNPDFIEAKGYVHVGESRKRLPHDAMPYHEDVRAFAEDLEKVSSFEIKDESKPSRVVLLTK
jgi:tRNA wybutosine-synthesizing protein 1